MKDAIVYTTFGIIIFIGVAFFQHTTNDYLQTKCENKGGEYYRANDVNKSLCKLPTK